MTKKEVEKLFDEKWKSVECSAHERTSSAACICDSLEDINADYGYNEIKSFIHTIRQQDREAIREFVESKEKDVSVGGISTATELRVKQQNYDYNRALSDILEYLETLEKKQ